MGAEIWPFQFPVTAIFDFLHNGHQGSSPTCVRWFLKTLYPYLTPCKVLKSCHKVHNFYKYWHIPFPLTVKKRKGSPYSITERRVPELIPVLGSQPAGDVSHTPAGRLPLLSARPAVTLATLKKSATNFGAWWTEAQWVWTVRLRLLSDSVAAAIWTRALLRLSPARWPLVIQY